MKLFIRVWFVFTVSLLVTIGVFAAAFALGMRSPYIGGLTSAVLIVCIQILTPWVRKRVGS
jgi:hypothetical protein